VEVVKDCSMIVAVTVDIEMEINRGGCTTPDGRISSLSKLITPVSCGRKTFLKHDNSDEFHVELSDIETMFSSLASKEKSQRR